MLTYSILSIQTFLLLLICIWTRNLLTRRRAHLTILNLINAVIAPIGMFCIIAAAYVTNIYICFMLVSLANSSIVLYNLSYVSDTAATIDAPQTAFVMFVVGIVMVLVCFLGLFGYFVDSKGLTSVYGYITFTLCK